MKTLVRISRYFTYINNRKYHCLTSATKNVYCNSSTTEYYETIKTSHAFKREDDGKKLNIPQKYLTIRSLSLGRSAFAKNKDKGKDKKKRAVVQHIDENEMAELIDIGKYKKDMSRVLEDLKNDLIKHISVRSSVGSIEEIKVKLDDKTYTIQELAQVARKPKMVVINCSAFPQATKIIVDSLSSSEMNLNPQQDGTTLYVPIPKVTKEHRELLAKNAKGFFNKCREKLQGCQNKQLKIVKDKNQIALDLSRRVQEQIKAMYHKYIAEAEEMVNAKQKEMLGE